MNPLIIKKRIWQVNWLVSLNKNIGKIFNHFVNASYRSSEIKFWIALKYFISDCFNVQILLVFIYCIRLWYKIKKKKYFKCILKSMGQCYC